MMLTTTFGTFALLLAAAPSAVEVDPGWVVRWPGDGIETCAMGGRSWTPEGGACFYAVDLLRKQGPLVLARMRNGRPESTTVMVAASPFPLERLTLPRRLVELSPKDLERVRRENRQIGALWGRSGPRRFGLPLHTPLDPLPPGGHFGTRRIINGVRRSPHSGCDYPASAGVPVLAAADGVVALVADHFFGGRSIFLDHGDGLITMYMHLSATDVQEGQEVRGGQRIGAVGSTGRATGPHLHFGARWHGARVNPEVLLGLAPFVEIR